MSEQERAKIDRFIAWLLEHPENDSGSGASPRPGIIENPLRRAIPARHKGFLFYRVQSSQTFISSLNLEEFTLTVSDAVCPSS